ncbi:cell division protein FtsZ [Streptobacillus felis]|uniref:Cell division protein FtsZ n=1 Tax=Streptobacillus felis TaxID=1384509 RepID=A0A7Z0T6V5_9FUSO|nr:cell division protein FtsZ [Streptobacillus felis]NYV27636.1 cell division protein FtsZ [Streptobacillus felis]
MEGNFNNNYNGYQQQQVYMNNMQHQAVNANVQGAKISIIGVGGGGGNAVDYMKEYNIEGVQYIAINTDFQDLEKKAADIKFSIGTLGAGGDPSVARAAADEMRNEIKKIIQGQDMIFITAGMGGGTGTGASPIVAEIARELNILTIAVVTTPFKFEGPRRRTNAENGINELKKHVDTLIVIPNDKLLTYKTSTNKVRSMFLAPNEVLFRSVKGIAEVITKEGLINIDFADVKYVMKDAGEAVVGLGIAEQGKEASVAVREAIESPLLDRNIKGAKKLLLNITISPEAPFEDFHKIVDEVTAYSENPDLDVMLGVMTDESTTDTRVTIVATGFDNKIESVASTVEVIRESENHTEENSVKEQSFVFPRFDD